MTKPMRHLLVGLAMVGTAWMVVQGLCCVIAIWLYTYPQQVLKALPAPPNTRVDQLAAQTEWADWERILEVDQPYTEVVAFYKDVMPDRGWKLVEEHSRQHRTGSIWSCLVYRRLSEDVQFAIIGKEENGVPVEEAEVLITTPPFEGYRSMCQEP
jgi:hypothetical protein